MKWEDPPGIARPPTKRTNWVRELNQLKPHPGRWALVANKDSATSAGACAWQLKNGYMKIPGGCFEFLSRGKKVYARYLGEADRAENVIRTLPLRVSPIEEGAASGEATRLENEGG